MHERNWGTLSAIIVLTFFIFGLAILPGIAEAGNCTDADADAYAVEGKKCGPVDCDDADPLVNPGTVEVCSNGIDDDCDGTTDVGDTDCCTPTGGGEYVGFNCADGIDNDCDGLTDCDDDDCANPIERDPNCPCPDADGDTFSTVGFICGQKDCDDSNPAVYPGAPEECTDGIDNDCDNLIDWQDPDAVNCPPCPDADGDTYSPYGFHCGPVDCNDADPTINPGAPEVCDNGIDDNCNGYPDGSDPGCGGCIPSKPPFEICDDGIDNDCNGFTDCEDLENCGGNFRCGEVACDDGLDNDGNGLFDCDDPHCQEWRQFICGEIYCSDNIDNDGDGKTDCSDNDCDGIGACGPEICTDGIDNDSDGKTDCADKKDCGKDPAC